MTAVLSIQGVSRSFATTGGAATVALQATDLRVAENDFVTILGPSGCGKSTLLRIVAGFRQHRLSAACRRHARGQGA